MNEGWAGLSPLASCQLIEMSSFFFILQEKLVRFWSKIYLEMQMVTLVVKAPGMQRPLKAGLEGSAWKHPMLRKGEFVCKMALIPSEQPPTSQKRNPVVKVEN